MSGNNSGNSGNNTGKGATRYITPEEHETNRKNAKARKQANRRSRGMHQQTLLTGLQEDRKVKREEAHLRRVKHVCDYAVMLLEEHGSHQFQKDDTVVSRWSKSKLRLAERLMKFYFFGNGDAPEVSEDIERMVQRFYLLTCEVFKTDSRDTYARQDWYDNEERKKILPFVKYNRDQLRKERTVAEQPEAVAS